MAIPSSLFAWALAALPALVTHVQDAYPVLSPDGATLAFQSTRNGRWALYLAQPDGANVRLLLDSGDDPVTPSWSPDGQRIAFAASVDGQSEIFVMDRNGADRRRLTNDEGDDSHPHFGADGRIYFNSARTTPDRSAEWDRQHHEIFSIDAAGGNLRQHTRCRAVCTFPSPSPDGRWIAYRKVIDTPGRNWDQSVAPRNSEVMVARIDGSDERNVSAHPAFDGWPVWSPDSQWIAFSSNREGQILVGQVFIVRSDGNDMRRISDGPLSNVQPSIAPDGGSILTSMVYETPRSEASSIASWPIAAPGR